MVQATLVVLDERTEVRLKTKINVAALLFVIAIWALLAIFTIRLAITVRDQKHDGTKAFGAVELANPSGNLQASFVHSNTDNLYETARQVEQAIAEVSTYLAGLEHLISPVVEGSGGYDASTVTAAAWDNLSEADAWQFLQDSEESLRHAADVLGDIRSVEGLKRSVIDSIPFGWPVQTRRGTPTGWVSFEFGPRIHPITGEWYLHKGFDIAALPGTHVVATARGTVEEVEYSDINYGNNVVVRHAAGFQTRYPHLQRIFVNKGQPVDPGTLIGEVGESGEATGSHLHYEIMIGGEVVDPAPFLMVTTTFDREPALRRAAAQR